MSEEKELCSCGKEGTLQLNPFVKELYDEDQYQIMCDDCYYQAAMDV